MHATLPLLAATDFPPIRRRVAGHPSGQPGLQVQPELPALPRQRPARSAPKMMDGETIALVLEVLRAPPRVDAGPHRAARRSSTRTSATAGAAGRPGACGVHVIDRCNLTILSGARAGRPGRSSSPNRCGRSPPPCLAIHRPTSTVSAATASSNAASPACASSMRWATAMTRSASRPGAEPRLQPAGRRAAAAAGAAGGRLQARARLLHFGIRFDHLFALTNMPIQRFGSTLVSKGTFGGYMQLLQATATGRRTSTP